VEVDVSERRRDPTAYDLERVIAVYDALAASEDHPTAVLEEIAETAYYLDNLDPSRRGAYILSERLAERLGALTAWERCNLLLRLADLARAQLVAVAKEHEREARRLDRERGDGR
jgi:hypothetical protein